MTDAEMTSVSPGEQTRHPSLKPGVKYGGVRGAGGKLYPPEVMEGTYRGNGNCASMKCERVEVTKADACFGMCKNGICVYK